MDHWSGTGATSLFGPGRECGAGKKSERRERTVAEVILILILIEPFFLASFCPFCPLRLDAKGSDRYGFPPPETWPSG
jgi:hypothetical protein